MHVSKNLRSSASLLLTFLLLCQLLLSCRSRRAILEKRVSESYKAAYQERKQELRAAWLQTVYRQDLPSMSKSQMQAYFSKTLDSLEALHFNALFFQVRPESDAFYASKLEPWSRFFTGVQGKAPDPYWDPLEWMVKECHRRGMELHAWINPYRAAVNAQAPLSPLHPYQKHPENFFRYGRMLLYKPYLEENRQHICQVIDDIVSRYDVDGIHLDDYFYPYPIAGESLADEAAYRRDAHRYAHISDWRRSQVTQLVREIKATIMLRKPWVKLGISPFGIYRNKQSAKEGSYTRGLQNYDDLYADILLWDKEKLVDYLVPQLYWELAHPTAAYTELVEWWAKHLEHAHYYVGQDVARTMKASELHPKLVMSRKYAQGNVFWPVDEVLKKGSSIRQALRAQYFRSPALIPPSAQPGVEAPTPVRRLRAAWTAQGYALIWESEYLPYSPSNAYYFVVYCFGRGEKIDLSAPEHIVHIGSESYYILPYTDGDIPLTYVVTAVSRFHLESMGIKTQVYV